MKEVKCWSDRAAGNADMKRQGYLADGTGGKKYFEVKNTQSNKQLQYCIWRNQKERPLVAFQPAGSCRWARLVPNPLDYMVVVLPKKRG